MIQRAYRSAMVGIWGLSALCASAGCTVQTYQDVPSNSDPNGDWPPAELTPEPRPVRDAGTRPNATPPLGTTGRYDAGVPADERPAACAAGPVLPVERWKELLIIEPSVVQDPRADNARTGAPWSFHTQLLRVAGTEDAAARTASSWLQQWQTRTDVPVGTAYGNEKVPVTPRPSVDAVVMCPWLQMDPNNRCDADCTSCARRRLPLDSAPVRLLAIVNRMDVATADDECAGDLGELRFVYTFVQPRTGAPLPFTVIFEYALGSGNRPAWARAWHSLGAQPFGAPFNERLEALLAGRLAEARLARVLSNEVALGDSLGLPWELRQFVPALGDDGVVSMTQTPVSTTPRLSLSGTTELATYLRDNAAATTQLPTGWVAATAPLPTADWTWAAPGADPARLRTFSQQTCNGCHGGRGTDPVPFQHVAAPQTASYYGAGPVAGPALVSRYLDDPDGEDELDRRSARLSRAACAVCAAPSPRAPY